VLPNRIAKAAMTEGLADPLSRAGEAHNRLYQRWARGGAGLLITGNVLIDRRYLERPGNVVIEGPQNPESLGRLAAWAAAAKACGGRVIMQISHAGRQSPRLVCPEPIAPSAIALGLPGGAFAPPRAMTEAEIRDVIQRFGAAAAVAEEAGFDGVQIHAAHGYLLSEFLSPLANRRTDQWGGSLENRARILLETLRAVRRGVGAGFAVSVKLNSADFQKSGFSLEDCLAVVDLLNDEGVDLLEITGGTYEQPRMAGIDGLEPRQDPSLSASTRAREAYFIVYAAAVRRRARMPVMATGGFRSRAAMDVALGDGEADVIGLARPMCVEPELPRRLLSDETASAERWEDRLSLGPTRFLSVRSPIGLIKAINAWGQQGWFCLAIQDLAQGRAPNVRRSVLGAFAAYQAGESAAARALQGR
jgi:2,4-dienoyl-CoA reductase-like NADH-dependent reductase (Old Yellow Enzyme family)